MTNAIETIHAASATLPADWRASCPDTYGERLYHWPIAEGLHLYVVADPGCEPYAEISTDGVEDYSRLLDFGDAEPAEALAEMGIAPSLADATPDYSGPCRIWCQPHYYAGSLPERFARYLRDDAGEILEYESYADAAAEIERLDNEPSGYDGIPARNVLAHGQYAADTLRIVEA